MVWALKAALYKATAIVSSVRPARWAFKNVDSSIVRLQQLCLHLKSDCNVLSIEHILKITTTVDRAISTLSKDA